MDNEIDPFSNNLGENDIRMKKFNRRYRAIFAQLAKFRFFSAYGAIGRPAEYKASNQDMQR
jgi:hypothetical protein